MKNATKHADDLKALLKRLLKEGQPPERLTLDPVRALVRGTLSYNTTDAKADAALAVVDREFTDLNELRVATDLEIVELIGNAVPDLDGRISAITQSLNYIFEKEHTLSLERLKTLGKKEARQFLRELPESRPFVDGYVMLFGLEASAVPIDEDILGLLIDVGALEEGTTTDEAQRFVEGHLKADEYYPFYAVARRHVAEKSKRKR